MAEFFQTVMGRQFFENTLPKLTESIERLAAAVESADKQSGKPHVTIVRANEVVILCTVISTKTTSNEIRGVIKDLTQSCKPNYRCDPEDFTEECWKKEEQLVDEIRKALPDDCKVIASSPEEIFI